MSQTKTLKTGTPSFLPTRGSKPPLCQRVPGRGRCWAGSYDLGRAAAGSPQGAGSSAPRPRGTGFAATHVSLEGPRPPETHVPTDASTAA